MLVDDHVEIRTLMRMLITAAAPGVRVVCEASSGDEALELLDACDPNVIVLDQMMPGLTGLETAARIRERRPGQRMIFCSAYLDDRLRRLAADAGFVAIVSKDDIAELPRLVREVASG